MQNNRLAKFVHRFQTIARQQNEHAVRKLLLVNNPLAIRYSLIELAALFGDRRQCQQRIPGGLPVIGKILNNCLV